MSQPVSTAHHPQPDARTRRVLVVGDGDIRTLLPSLAAAGLELVHDAAEADFVISHCGDGSLLGADRAYPHLPKLAIRRNGDYQKCPDHQDEDVFRRVRAGRQRVTHLPRLHAEIRGHVIYAINDIVFHNENPASAIRYVTYIDGTDYAGEIVGDGVVVATPFGSSAYYRSITCSVFRLGIGLAFNNSTEKTNHLVLRESSTIEILVTRGPGVLLADNSTEPIPVASGDRIKIRLSAQMAEIWELDTLTCKRCIHLPTGQPAGWRHV